MKKRTIRGILGLSLLLFWLSACAEGTVQNQYVENTSVPEATQEAFTDSNEPKTQSIAEDCYDTKSQVDLSDIPKYSGEPYVELTGNIPDFTGVKDISTSFERYGELDSLGRCTQAFANIAPDIMPTEKRGAIGQVKPTGWHLVKYDIVDGKYLYNRCHLIAFQLAGENANEKNLITGTRYMNVTGMLPFENKVADYVHETGNHVLYRVTPVFEGDNLVADGVEMEAWSVEDQGKGICFHVFVYNCQPGITIDYATGDSALAGEALPQNETEEQSGYIEKEQQEDSTEATYILNRNTKKFHVPSCSSVKDMKAKNKEEFQGERAVLVQQGYEPCKRCNP